MIVTDLPSSVKKFIREYCDPADKWLGLMLGSLLVGFVLVRGRRTLAALGDCVAECRRDRSRLSRFFVGHADDVTRAFARAVRRSVTRVFRRCNKRGERRWLLVIDTTFQSKHARKMESLIKYKEKSRGVPSGNHGFVVGLLIGPDGTRIPLPVEDFMTRAFLKTINTERRRQGETPLAHRTQLDLAVQLVRNARELLPRSVSLWVVADNFFEGPKLDSVCAELDLPYVTVLDKARLVSHFLDNGGVSVRSYQKALPDREFRRVAIPEGSEPWASARRRAMPKRKPGRRPQNVYQVARQRLHVNGLGERTVLFSWKRRRLKYNTHRAQENLKVLITNAHSADTEDILDAYAMRWQIELFFRELKSDLGLGHYQVLTMAAIRTHVHLVLLSFLLLEMQRLDAAHAGGPDARGAPGARTRQLAVNFEAQVREEEVNRIQYRANNPQRLRDWVSRVFIPRRVASKKAG